MGLCHNERGVELESSPCITLSHYRERLIGKELNANIDPVLAEGVWVVLNGASLTFDPCHGDVSRILSGEQGEVSEVILWSWLWVHSHE